MNNFIFLLLSCIPLSTVCMNIPTHIVPFREKPTITGNLYIDTKESPCYGGKLSIIKQLEHSGIRSNYPHQPSKMPLIPVIMMVKDFEGEDRCWSKNFVPQIIIKHEEYEIIRTGRKIVLSDYSNMATKTFPDLVPADLLYNSSTGSIVPFTVHGYPVRATCSNNSLCNSSFREQFDQKIHQFIKKPSFTVKRAHYKKDEQELIDTKILTKNHHHGEMGFTSLEDLLCEDKKKTYSSMHNYVMQRPTGIKPYF
jgi:hypothetical protein